MRWLLLDKRTNYKHLQCFNLKVMSDIIRASWIDECWLTLGISYYSLFEFIHSPHVYQNKVVNRVGLSKYVAKECDPCVQLFSTWMCAFMTLYNLLPATTRFRKIPKLNMVSAHFHKYRLNYENMDVKSKFYFPFFFLMTWNLPAPLYGWSFVNRPLVLCIR